METARSSSSTSSSSSLSSSGTGTGTVPPPVSSLLLKSRQEDEDEEDAPLPIVSLPVKPEAVRSKECSEALQAIDSDPWDVNSWLLFLHEVEEGHGGGLSVIEAYQRFLERFPRAAKYWKILAGYHVKAKNYAAAEEVFAKAFASKCRNVELWLAYITMVRTKILNGGRESGHDMKPVEVAFEKAVENVGSSLDAWTLWRAYVDFIRERKDWSDSNDGRRLAAFRKIYQKAVCIPQDNLDTLWREYEILEKKAGEHLAEKVLPEFEGKYSHAKTIFRERRRTCARIDFDRLAVPPSNSIAELQQLGLWNKWIRYEMTNPDNLSTEQHQAFMKMIYEQCLCSMLFHPEVWMGYARLQQEAGGSVEGKQVYREAIENVPDVVTLRVALAELEEAEGNKDVAKAVLKAAFEKLPSAFTFAALQRFVRRKEGMTAARKIFSDTLPLRRDPAYETLSLDLYMAHSQLELDVNCCPSVALKALELAQQTYPHALQDMRFVRLIIQVLTLRGDLKQLRWLFHTTLGDAATAMVTDKEMEPSALAIQTSSGSGKTKKNQASSKSSGHFERSLKDQLELWDEYLKAETLLGLTDVKRLDTLRKARDKARTASEENEKTRQSMGGGVSSLEMGQDKVYGLFDSAYEFGERYEQLGALSLPAADAALRQRSRNRIGAEIDSFRHQDGGDHRIHSREGGGGSRGGRPRGRFAEDESGILGNLPHILRDFIPRLPTHSGPVPDVDGFIRQLRGCILPPRPAEITSTEMDYGGGGGGGGGGGSGIQPITGVKRGVGGMDGPSSSSFVIASTSNEEDDDEEEENDPNFGIREDVFRQRQRQQHARLALS